MTAEDLLLCEGNLTTAYSWDMIKQGGNKIRRQIQFTCQLFREGDQIASLCPELNVSGFGDTPKEAEAALYEAVGLFLEECEQMGTLNEVLEEV